MHNYSSRIDGRKAKALRAMSFCGSALMAVAWSGLAIAQTSNPAPNPVTTSAATESQAASTGLQEIIVTASRRPTGVQKESRSINVLTSADLAKKGITDEAQVQTLVPGLVIAKNGVLLQVFIRGVGDRSISFANDPAVALNVDGVYYPRTYEGGPQFFDLDRVEVLKGPQGTLYGRNATAGALNVITTKPKFDNDGFGEVEIGDYGLVRTTGALNTALSDTLAIRMSGQVIRRNGYLSDGYNDDKEEAARLEVLYKPDPATTVLLSGSYSHIGGMGQAAVIRDPVNFKADPWTGPSAPASRARIALTEPYPWLQAIPQANGYQDIHSYALTADITHDFGAATLTVLPSYIYSSLHTLSYAALVVPGSFDTTSDQKSIEARLSSPLCSRINWVAGGLASKEHVNDNKQSYIPFPGGVQDLFNVSPKRDDTTWALFGETNATITHGLRLIGGLRYTYEKKLVDSYAVRDLFYNAPGADGVLTTNPFPDPVIPARPADPTADASGTRTDRVVNFRAGVEYDIAPRSMVYATVATGFKAGGFYSDVTPNSYLPEKLTAYDVGVKNRFFNNRLQVNVEGYYWKYHNKQESVLSVGNLGANSIILKTVNAGQVTLYGADVSIVGQITHNDTISLEGEYNHSKYNSFILVNIADGGITNCPITAGPAVGAPGTNNNTPRTYDCSGRPLPRAPQWTGRVSYDHTQHLRDGSELVFDISTRVSSSYFLASDYTSSEYFKGFRTSDASLTWNSPSGKLSLTAYVKNIENRAIYTGATQSTAFGTLAQPGAVALISPPRTFGGRVRVSF